MLIRVAIWNNIGQGSSESLESVFESWFWPFNFHTVFSSSCSLTHSLSFSLSLALLCVCVCV